MSEQEQIAELFEAHRAHLSGVAYRMLGSHTEADDAVQEAWLRLSRSGTGGIDNLGGWLTTVVSRVALDMLRARSSRREEPLETRVPDPVVTAPEGTDPQREAEAADAVGLALLVVLETLEPAERLAFVLHDLFGVPFSDVATAVDRTPDAARQLASRARRRVRGAATASAVDLRRQRRVVDAFLAASREGDFEALLAVLDPDVVVRADSGPRRPGLNRLTRGASEVATQAREFRRLAASARPVLVNGNAGLVTFAGGEPFSIVAVTVRGERISEVNILADPDRIAALDLAFLSEETP